MYCFTIATYLILLLLVWRVTTEPYLNPNVRESKNWVFDMAFVRRFAQPVTLREIRESHLFDNWTLLRQKQVSVMDVPDSFIEWLKARRTL
jgi:predicted RNA-binding protein with PUA-like domain